MKVISHNTVNVLFDKAEALGQEPHESWKCVFFNFHDKPEKNNHALFSNFVVRPIINMLSSSNGYIYLCGDGDIFVLFQGALKPILAKLSEHFGDINPQVKGQNDDLCKIFDLSKHWDRFHDLCEAKYLDNLVHEDDEHRTPLTFYGRTAKVLARTTL